MRVSLRYRQAGAKILSTVVGRSPRASLLVGALLLAAPSTFAVAQEVRMLAEDDFLQRFEESDARFKEIDARAQSAGAEIVAARVWANPSFSYDREEVFPSGGSLPENYARLEMPIEISGRRSRRVAAAELGAEAAQAEAERERWMLRLEALDAYHDAALVRLEAETLRTVRRPLLAVAEAMAARARAGEASGYDRDRLDVELTAQDDLLAETEALLSVARRTLAALVGDAGALYDASDPLAIPTQPAALPQTAEDTLATRPDYRAAATRVQQAESQLSAARRAWVPDLTLSAGWKSSDTGQQVADGYTAGLGLSVPLFSHGQAEREAALASRRAAEARLRFLGVQVPLAIENARDELARNAERARTFEQTQLPRIDALLRSADVSYDAGERSVFELVDAYRTARETRLHALRLRREAKRSEVELWRALGGRP